MKSRERMLTAMSGKIPDRVPASPDTNWLIPAKVLNRPFWDVYYYNEVPIWKAYNDYVKKHGLDGFSHHGVIQIPPHPDTETKDEIIEKTDEYLKVRTTFSCPLGELYSENVYPVDNAPTGTRNMITDLKEQFDFLPYLMGDYENATFDLYKKQQSDMGDGGVVGLCMLLPMLMFFEREPKESCFYDYYDHRELLDKYMKMYTNKLIVLAQKIIDEKVEPDFVFFPNSGLLTLQSEEIARRYTYPALQTLTTMFKKSGILTSLHSCGKELITVDFAANETDLDCIDPLEIPPMGDCVLREIKEKYGKKIALKGNLHTTDVMLRMNKEGVRKEAIKCLDAAMEGGGFILSTGDQCGRDTPQENIDVLVEVCEKEGRY